VSAVLAISHTAGGGSGSFPIWVLVAFAVLVVLVRLWWRSRRRR